MDGQLQLVSALSCLCYETHLCGAYGLALDLAHGFKLAHRGLRLPARNCHPIGLRHLVRGVHQSVRRLAVVRHYEQPLGVQVQPANRIQPPSRALHQLRHCLAPLLVRKRSNIAARFVQHYVNSCLRYPEPPAIHGHDVRIRVGGHTKGGGLAVHFYLALFYELLSGPARGQACRGYKLLEAFFQIATRPSSK